MIVARDPLREEAEPILDACVADLTHVAGAHLDETEVPGLVATALITTAFGVWASVCDRAGRVPSAIEFAEIAGAVAKLALAGPLPSHSKVTH